MAQRVAEGRGIASGVAHICLWTPFASLSLKKVVAQFRYARLHVVYDAADALFTGFSNRELVCLPAKSQDWFRPGVRWSRLGAKDGSSSAYQSCISELSHHFLTRRRKNRAADEAVARFSKCFHAREAGAHVGEAEVWAMPKRGRQPSFTRPL